MQDREVSSELMKMVKPEILTDNILAACNPDTMGFNGSEGVSKNYLDESGEEDE